MILIAILAIFIDDQLQRLNAVKNVLAMLANLVAGVIFALSGHVSWEAAGLLGRWCRSWGARWAGTLGRRLPQQALRTAVVVVGTVVAVILLV